MKKACALILALILLLCAGGCGKQPPEDGIYSIQVTLSGGSGRASIEEAKVEIRGEKVTASITWSSPYYDFMIIDGVRYEPVNDGGNAVFVIPAVLDQEMAVQADTVAMSQPHLIDYTLLFDSSTMKGE